MATLTITQIRQALKVLGKLAYLAGQGDAQTTSYKNLMVNTLRQGMDGQDTDDYDLFQSVLVTLNSGIKGVVTKVVGVRATAKTAAESYLQQVLAPRYSTLTATSTILAILDALRGDMIATGLYLDPTGTFKTFFGSTWNYNDLPTTGTTKIDDTYITADVV